MKKTAITAVLAAVALSGCTQRIADFTVMSTKNIEMSRLAEMRVGERLEGVDSKPIILLFPTGNPTIEEAIDNAIEQQPGGVALVNGTVSLSSFYLPPLFGEIKYMVEGDVLYDPERVSK